MLEEGETPLSSVCLSMRENTWVLHKLEAGKPSFSPPCSAELWEYLLCVGSQRIAGIAAESETFVLGCLLIR